MDTRSRIDISFTSPFSPALSAFASTPRTPASKKKKAAFVRPICDTCEKCGKHYRCHRSYLRHVRGHNIIEQASKFPKVHEIMHYLSSNCGAVFKKLKMNPAFATKGAKYKNYVETMVTLLDMLDDCNEWDQFKEIIHSAMTDGLQDFKFLLPSALLGTLQQNAERHLSNITERNQLSARLQVCAPGDDEVIQVLLADYVFFLIVDILKFVSNTVRANVPAVNDITVQLDIEYLETVHYIAGSKVRAFYRKSQQFPKHIGWKSIGRVISERLLESDSIPGPPANVKGWTVAQNRGRLFFVSATLFDFFCGVAEALERDTSTKRVDHEDIVEKVCESGVVLLWDEAVSDSMSEIESYNFMSAMVRSFCQTFSIGKAHRIMNNFRKKGEASIPLRHRVAPK